jgi:hypothetical protein
VASVKDKTLVIKIEGNATYYVDALRWDATESSYGNKITWCRREAEGKLRWLTQNRITLEI